MASRASTLARPAAFRGVGRSILLTLPIALWALLMFTPSFRQAGRDEHIGAAVVIVFMTALFFLMMRTGETYRWRRIFFVALGFLFPVGFIAALLAERGSMSIPISRMVSGDTPFCFMVTPTILLPAAFARTIIFPGSILPSANHPHSIAPMIGLWFALTLVLGKAWCSYACFFGGIEEGFAAFAKRRKAAPLRRSVWAHFAARAVGHPGVRGSGFGGDLRAGLLHVAVPVQGGHRVSRGAQRGNGHSDGDLCRAVRGPCGGVCRI